MNKIDVDRLKQELLDLRLDLQLQEEQFQLSNEPVELDQARLGRLSRMDAMQAQQMSLETSRRRQHQIVKVDGAINRIETDEYGFYFPWISHGFFPWIFLRDFPMDFVLFVAMKLILVVWH